VFNDTLALSLTGIAGRYFKLVFTLDGYPDVSVSSTTFQVWCWGSHIPGFTGTF